MKLLWLIPALPFLGFMILAAAGARMSKRNASMVGVGSVGISAALAGIIAFLFLSNPLPGNAYTQTLWTWMNVGGLKPDISLRLDSLSLVMTLVVTFVGFLIHLYSAEFMAEDEGYNRFFAYMNLFVGSMLILVLADNMLFLYMGWEGVGLCSYLLIGFWYKDPYNGYAARKAFIVTRIGDTALAIGLFLLFTNLGTLQIQEVLYRADQQWMPGGMLPVLAALLILGGAVGKSAQLPLQTWLPDAMAGPTPVSALIHAATMVTAGVYLIARTHAIFELAPAVMTLVAIIGAATLLVSAFSAITQTDIKRVLAYSTISQIGYMFLALGVGAWSAAIFHFMTHAFFKALLFLGAGAVILGLHHEHDMFKMGGLRKELPITFWSFLIGAASLSALPLVTAGYYSKDLILSEALTSPSGSPVLWWAGLIGAFLTSIYSFRMVFITFLGERKTEVSHLPGLKMKVPLLVLAFLSIAGGFIETPANLGDIHLFTGLTASVLPQIPVTGKGEFVVEALPAFFSIAGILIAYIFFLRRPQAAEIPTRVPFLKRLSAFFFEGWGFDRLYDRTIVQPYLTVSRASRNDFVENFFRGIVSACEALNAALVRTQTGNVRWYAMGITVGAILTLTIMVLA